MHTRTLLLTTILMACNPYSGGDEECTLVAPGDAAGADGGDDAVAVTSEALTFPRGCSSTPLKLWPFGMVTCRADDASPNGSADTTDCAGGRPELAGLRAYTMYMGSYGLSVAGETFGGMPNCVALSRHTVLSCIDIPHGAYTMVTDRPLLAWSPADIAEYDEGRRCQQGSTVGIAQKITTTLTITGAYRWTP